MKRLAALILLFSALPVMAGAQTWPGWATCPPPPGYDPHVAQAEQHRQAIDGLRLQADQREADAARMRLQTDQALRQLEAARTPAPAAPPPTAWSPRPTALPAPAPLSPQLDPSAPGVAEIDVWLNRAPH